MSTSVSSLTNNFFPSAENGFTTTTSGSVSSGAATVGLNSTAGYTNGEIVVFVIDPTDVSKKQTFTGVMDTGGSQVTSVVWTAGTNQTHALGATVVDYATATHISMMTKGLLQEHDQAGTHTDITATSVVTTGDITSNGDIISAGDLQIRNTSLDTIHSEYLADFVASGGVVAQSAGLVGTFSNIVYYISGIRYTKNSVSNKTYTASKDTYVDIDSSGTVTYTEATNGAASPSLTAGNIRVAKVVTNGSAITSVTQSGPDSLSNLIYNAAPITQTKVTLSGSQTASVATSQTTTSTGWTDLATSGPAVTVTIGTSGMALVEVGCSLKNSATNFTLMSFAVSGASTVSGSDTRAFGATFTTENIGSRFVLLTGLTPGSNTFTAKYRVGGGTGTFQNRTIVVIPI